MFCFSYLCNPLIMAMKKNSKQILKFATVLLMTVIMCNCATHKKEKCNTCPKWSKVDHSSQQIKHKV